jgi:hypothetical protein
MDKKPFLEVNLLDLKDAQIEELKKFHKSYFDIPTILSSASELKYMGELKTLISGETSSPSPDFVKHFGKQIYTGRFTPDTINQFAVLVKRAFTSYINDLISDRLKAVIEKEEEGGEQPQTEQAQVESVASNEKREIVTTEEELEAFYIVKSILRPYIPHERITYRDALSYFSVFVDDNNRKPVCRFYFNSEANKQIGLFGDGKEPVRCKINRLDDIYNYTEELIGTASQYLG